MKTVAENDRAVSGNNGVDASHLTAFIERIERVNDEVRAAQEDRKEIFAEAKSMGWDTAVIRQIVKLRAMDPAERHEARTMLELYAGAIGMEV